MNPFTVSWYLPVILAGEDGNDPIPLSTGSTARSGNSNAKSKASASASDSTEAEGIDAKFRRGLPDALYVARLLYRGIMMGSCPRLRELDSLRISEGERAKAGALVSKVEARKPELLRSQR